MKERVFFAHCKQCGQLIYRDENCLEIREQVYVHDAPATCYKEYLAGLRNPAWIDRVALRWMATEE